MNIDRSLRVTALLTAILAVFVLADAERDPMLGVLAVVICGAGYFINDVHGKCLNTFWGNLAALGALVLALWNFDIERPEMRLIAMANLLVYAQFVLFFREKNTQTYWMILLLSLLQICVACVLIDDFYFGLLLLAYMLLASYYVTLLSLKREWDAAKDIAVPVSKKGQASRLNRRRSGARAPGEQLDSAGPMRWALSRQQASFVPRKARKSKSLDLRGLRRHWGMVCLWTAIIAPLLFGVMPRASANANSRNNFAGSLSTTGFADEVTLGDIGMMLEDPAEVMRLSLKHPRTGESIELVVGEELLLRGVVNIDYADGKWSRPRNTGSVVTRNLTRMPAGIENHLVQEVDILPDQNKYLFGVHPVYDARGWDNSDNVKWDSHRQAMVRAERSNRETSYSTFTNGIVNRRMRAIIETPERVDYIARRHMLDYQRGADLLQLKQLADRLAAEVPAAASDSKEDLETFHRAIADRFVRHLRDSGEYQYSLKEPLRRGDPIEDFLFTNQSGFCEHFASALTLMLRTQGIPARIVNGFKAGEWNTLGKFYQFRMLHAHSWVEMYLSDVEDLGSSETASADPAAAATRRGGRSGSRWLILDPTPANPLIESTLWGNFRQFTDYLQHMWSSYVTGTDGMSQGMIFLRDFFDAGAWREFADDMKRMLSGDLSFSGFFSVRLIVTLCVLPLFIYGLVRLVVKTWRWAGKGPKKRKARELARQAQVEFYRRFEEILAARRIRRDASQTQREFATAVGGQFSGEDATRRLAAIPRSVADAFYRVRFGKHQLELNELKQLTSELDRLDAQTPKANGTAAQPARA